MDYTRQQMCGHKDFGPNTRTGNWREDVIRDADKMRDYLVKKECGELAGQKRSQAMRTALQEVTLTPQHADGFLRFGDIIMLQSADTKGCLAVDVNTIAPGRQHHYKASVSAGALPVARTAWTVVKARDPTKKFYRNEGEDDVVHYGQQVKISNRMCSENNLNLSAELPSPYTCLRGNKTGQTRGEVTACISGNLETYWQFVPQDVSWQLEMEGQPVKAGDIVVLKSVKSSLFLSSEDARTNSFGKESEVSTFHHRDTFTKHDSKKAGPSNLWGVLCAPAGSPFVPFQHRCNESVIDNVRQKLLQRCGGGGMRAFARSLRILDDNGNRLLDRRELKQGLLQYGLQLSVTELDAVFEVFDRDGDGSISVTEFVRTLRGSMNEMRLNVVVEAFNQIDTNKSGKATFNELHDIYGAHLDRHPDVESGSKTQEEVLLEFVSSWDKSGDGIVTRDEFIDYYTDLSASIDSDDFFTTMVRRAWKLE